MGNLLVRLLAFIGGGLLAAVGVIGFVAIVFVTPLIGIATGIAGMEFSLLPSIGFGVLSFVLFLAGMFIMKVALSSSE